MIYTLLSGYPVLEDLCHTQALPLLSDISQWGFDTVMAGSSQKVNIWSFLN